MRHRSHKVLIGSLAVVALTVSGCSTMPGSSAPHAIREYTKNTTGAVPQAPSEGQDPESLLQGFFAATAQPNQRHEIARQFLTAEAAQSWDDSTSWLIVNSMQLEQISGSVEEGTLTYAATGQLVGAMEAGGVYETRTGDWRNEFVLTRHDGNWRINNLPNGVVMEKSSFSQFFTAYELFFLNPERNMLVRDRRWIYNSTSNLGDTLMSLMVTGPRSSLSAGVTSEVPLGAVYTGGNGSYSFNGFQAISDEAKHRFAAQVVWTLSQAGVPGPYNITIDGQSLSRNGGGLTVDDVVDYQPNHTASNNTVFAVVNGSLVQVIDNHTEPSGGELGLSGRVEAAAVNGDASRIAAVVNDTGRQLLLVGDLKTPKKQVLQAGRILRPCWVSSNNELWTVVDGRKVVRFDANSTADNLGQSEVDTAALADLPGEITSFQLSYSGVRAAFIMGGKLYTATVATPAAGQRKLTNVAEIGAELGSSAVSLAWQNDAALFVATSNRNSIVWRLQNDGSEAIALPDLNISAPVKAVSAGNGVLYVTDSRALLQLDITNQQDASWQEVSGINGIPGVAVVPE